MGGAELSEKTITEYSLKCITKHKVDTFNQLCFIVYHEKNLQFNIERFPLTLFSIKISHHITHKESIFAVLHIASHSFSWNTELNPLDYGYKLDDYGNLLPILSTKQPILSNFQQPYYCRKCSRPNICWCLLKEVACCQYCKCKASTESKNCLKQLEPQVHWTIK